MMEGAGGLPFKITERRITIVFEGNYSPPALTKTLELILAHPDFVPGCDVLCDARTSTANLTIADIKDMLASLNAVGSQFSGTWAVVVSDLLRYGLTRMAAALAAPLGIKMEAFQTLAEAEEWLDAAD